MEEDAAQLRQRFSLQALVRYRLSLATFMRQVVESGLAVDFQASTVSLTTRSRKRYTIVKLVEEQSLALAALASQHQVDEIAILAKINRIRGLLIDLLS